MVFNLHRIPFEYMKKKRKGLLTAQEKISLSIVGIFHLVGLLLLTFSSGLIYGIALDFVPINLILTTLVVLKFQKEYSQRFWIFCSITFVSGFLVEMIGVNTGLIFGSYEYGEVLGPGLFGTPYIIGLNWLLLSYCVISLFDFFQWAVWIKYFLSIALLVGTDYLIEPVAMRLGFWNWKEGIIPLQNYLGWAGVSAILFFQPYVNKFPRRNRVAAFTFLIQVLFFLIQNIF